MRKKSPMMDDLKAWIQNNDLLPIAPGDESISADREKIRLNKNCAEDCFCQVCGQRVKLYARKLNANMVMFLLGLIRLYQKEDRWISHKEVKHGGRDYPYIADWDLATTLAKGKGIKSGMWAPTTKGLRFAWGEIQVPSHLFIYDKRVYGQSTRLVGIREALGEKFDYQELMTGIKSETEGNGQRRMF